MVLRPVIASPLWVKLGLLRRLRNSQKLDCERVSHCSSCTAWCRGRDRRPGCYRSHRGRLSARCAGSGSRGHVSQREFFTSLGFGAQMKGVVSIEEIERRLGDEFDPRTLPADAKSLHGISGIQGLYGPSRTEHSSLLALRSRPCCATRSTNADFPTSFLSAQDAMDLHLPRHWLNPMSARSSTRRTLRAHASASMHLKYGCASVES